MTKEHQTDPAPEAEPVLVINAGSSTVKYQLIDVGTGQVLAKGIVERIGETASHTRHTVGGENHDDDTRVADHAEAMDTIAEAFAEYGPDLDRVGLRCVGHRVVHGGDRFGDPVVVTDEVLAQVEELNPLAPLHNPANIEGIRVSQKRFRGIPQVAIFDTAFHHTLPEAAYTYAVPLTWRDGMSVRRYGFHGTSYSFVSRHAAHLLGREPSDVNLVVLHLGSGASAAAVRGGRSVDTSMGMTPLEGLVMGTRSGDIDPGIVRYLVAQGMTPDDIDSALNRDSGLKGLSGTNDLRELEERIERGDAVARLAFDVMVHRLRKYVGAYTAVLGRVDAVVFTAGVGENSELIRAATCADLGALGIALDPAANAERSSRERVISAPGSRVAVLVIPTNEELEIARQAAALVSGGE